MASNKQPGIKKTPRLTEADKLIRRVNNYLRQSSRLLGADSSQQQYAQSQLSSFLTDPWMVSIVDGVPQISRSRRMLEIISQGGAEAKAIKKIDALPTIKEEKARLLQQYERARLEEEQAKIAELGLKGKLLEDALKKAEIKSKVKQAAQAAAIQHQASIHRRLNRELSKALDALYAVLKDTGNLEQLDDIRALSRGMYTTADAKRQMIALAKQRTAEEEEIRDEFFEDQGMSQEWED